MEEVFVVEISEQARHFQNLSGTIYNDESFLSLNSLTHTLSHSYSFIEGGGGIEIFLSAAQKEIAIFCQKLRRPPGLLHDDVLIHNLPFRENECEKERN